MAGKDRLFLDADVTLDHLSDRQPFAESAHRLFAMAETGEVQVFVSALTFSHLYFLLKKGRTRAETLSLLATLKRITSVATVGDKEIQSALVSAFGDFEDAIQHFSAKGEPGIHAIITRNKADFSPSEISVLSPDEYLVQFAPRLPEAND